MSTWETFRCPRCAASFEVRIDLSIDRRILVSCAACGQEQRLEIREGRIGPVQEAEEIKDS